jgi:hypothetical protein
MVGLTQTDLTYGVVNIEYNIYTHTRPTKCEYKYGII